MSGEALMIKTNQYKTYVFDAHMVDLKAVPEDIQLFVNDLIYYLFYNNFSELQELLRSSQLTATIAKNTIDKDFSVALPHLLGVYPTIESATLDIEDLYIANQTLYTEITLNVKSTTGTITREVSTKIPMT